MFLVVHNSKIRDHNSDTYFIQLMKYILRIDKGYPGGALYSGTCVHNYGNCNGRLCIA